MGNTMEPTTRTKEAPFQGMPQEAFELLEALRADNTPDWMRAFRSSVLTDLKGPFIRYLEATTLRLQDAGF